DLLVLNKDSLRPHYRLGDGDFSCRDDRCLGHNGFDLGSSCFNSQKDDWFRDLVLPEVSLALKNVDRLVEAQYVRGGIEGLVVAIVTSRDGAIYERVICPLKANETDMEKPGHVDRHSIFRLASGSKLFAALETWVLRERGALNLDDPVHKFFPDLNYLPDGWGGTKDGRMASGPVTVRQLASHMSDLTRMGPPPNNGRGFPTTEEMIDGLKMLPLNVPTYHCPVYSNVAIGLLGQVNVAANGAFVADPTTLRSLGRNLPNEICSTRSGEQSPRSCRFSVQGRSGVLRLFGYHGLFWRTDELAVGLRQAHANLSWPNSSREPPPSVGHTRVDATPVWLMGGRIIGDWNAVGDREDLGFVQPPTVHFSKTAFAINQDMAYGIAVLMTGTTPINDLVLDIFRAMQPILDRSLAADAAELYSGACTPIDGSDESKLLITVMAGSLWMTELRLKGTGVLGVAFPTPEPIALSSTGRLHEFRMVFASPSKNCISSWTAIDDGFSQGHPNDLVYLTDDGLLHIPSFGSL
ncbi:unnamed protein product, partial [Mycena citricolor]